MAVPRNVLTVTMLALALAMYSAPANAASSSGCWRVVNVTPGDSLNMRASPSHNSAIVDRLVPNGHGIIGAQGTCTPGSKPWAQRWCPVSHSSGNYPTTRGWVKARFLQGAGCP